MHSYPGLLPVDVYDVYNFIENKLFRERFELHSLCANPIKAFMVHAEPNFKGNEITL